LPKLTALNGVRESRIAHGFVSRLDDIGDYVGEAHVYFAVGQIVEPGGGGGGVVILELEGAGGSGDGGLRFKF
jgi:hypothetical protein